MNVFQNLAVTICAICESDFALKQASFSFGNVLFIEKFIAPVKDVT